MAAISLPIGAASAQQEKANSAPTVLWLQRGSDQVKFDYNTEQGYRIAAYLLRDIQAGKMAKPDWRMLQTLSWMQTWLALHGHHVVFEVLSGLRTPATNSRTENAAQNSMHLPDQQGIFRAVDFKTKSIPSSYLGQVAARLKQGGVGFYTRDFLHLDTGNLIGKSGQQRIWFSR
ncbi:MAG: DUF882 domain-containing protein [Burkholderiales bacterium]|nr:DUF882 domain-containing protein [Burkholderiales bacterium]